ncbi:DAK2 domain-containing protein [Nocardia brasiliensis]|uniref:Dihydroxyacetone kinase n=1 Tax=Nocardia brasiliensis (strain ATCC 700358 / HUJEG-1) TaxID=1133849 RepID=K0EWR8_NOCB7|nr:DAK2 domain-containing protein [Nocardia brasiliensis]AFU04268.1 dihydroxyacetone kinase [Nocardia brasiliensis ATCC 700358]OCF91414.1 dihydroxyacetone kinase [Nocardia brasiliensis]
MDGTALLRWGRTCLDGLAHRREEINALNVFPIPDADTGTNLLATMRAAMAAAEAIATPSSAREVTAHEVAAAMARGATIGARGNSGIILSQVLRGIAEAVRAGPLTAATLREALRRAAVLVRAALSVPIEGTILTVLDCAAASAAADADGTLAEVALAAADGAAKALGETPSQLGVLRDAGVVDAGARGLVVLLDSLVSVTLGEIPSRPEYTPKEPGMPRPEPEPAETASPTPQYEVMYLLSDTDEARLAALRARLTELGDSVVVVGDGQGSWSAHVHCADAGAAVEAGLATGRLSGIRIESFALARHEPLHDAAEQLVTGDELPVPEGPADRGILAVAAGDGAAALFEDAGAVVLDGDGPVTAAALLDAIRAMPNREVLVLPNGALPAHDLVAVGVAARDAHRDVLLLPSASVVQGLAALAVHDRGRIAVDDAFAMSEAAATTRWGALRAAPERALTMVGTCEAGDGLGLVGHDVVVIDHDVRAAGLTLLDRMLAFGGELVTLLMGAAAPDGLADALAAHIGDEFPGVEVTVYSGGQHGDLVQIGVE